MSPASREDPASDVRDEAPKLRALPLVTVQFRADAVPRWDDGATEQVKQHRDTRWSPLELRFPGLRLKPLLPTAASHIDALLEEAERRTPRYARAPLLSLFRVVLPPMDSWGPLAPHERGDALAAELRALMLEHLPIVRVTIETRLMPPPIVDGMSKVVGAGSHRPGRERDQLHLNAAPVGMNANAVWDKAGGRGQSELLADVEQGWHMAHFDFKTSGELAAEAALALPAPAAAACLSLIPGGDHSGDWAAHGTSVLGIAIGRQNDDYGLGVAPLVPQIILSSEYRGGTTDADKDTEVAIWLAILELLNGPPGAVLLLEVEVYGADFLQPWVTKSITVPCEANPWIFLLIEFAVAHHIVVVEAAGNGGVFPDADVGLDLQDPVDLMPFDSGAILVGRSLWKDGVGHCAFSNGIRGKRIDCFGPGDHVYAAACTGAHEPFSDFDTPNFNGTSAAAAIIAGAALVVQGLARNHPMGLGYLPPMQMRALLRDRRINTPLATDGSDVIGVMPDLQAIAEAMGLLPDLYIRDNIGDSGGAHAGRLWQSPDIIACSPPLAAVPTPAARFGQGSGTENDDDLGDPLVSGRPAELYVRLRNRGADDMRPATVTVWYAKASMLTLPPWTLIGSTTVTVPQGNVLTVAGPIRWVVPDTTGHYCFIATVSHPADQLFTPTTFNPVVGGVVPAELSDVDHFAAWIRTENNAAWRNFHVLAVPEFEGTVLSALFSGAPGGDDADMELQVESHLPFGATVEIELPEKLAARLSLPVGAFDVDSRRTSRRGRVSPVGVTSLGCARLAAGERHLVTLHVRLPKRASASCEVALVQRYSGTSVGRAAWRLKPAVSRAPSSQGQG